MITCLVYSFRFVNEVNLLLLESLVKGGYKEKDDVKFLRKNPEFCSKSETVEHEATSVPVLLVHTYFKEESQERSQRKIETILSSSVLSSTV